MIEKDKKVKKDSDYKRYPMFPIRLRPDDRKALEEIKKHYGLRTLADGMRLALRVLLFATTADYIGVAVILKAYEHDNPDCWKITIGGNKEG